MILRTYYIILSWSLSSGSLVASSCSCVYTPSPSNKKDQAPSETLGLFLIPGLSLAFSVGLSVALFFSLWLWGSLAEGLLSSRLICVCVYTSGVCFCTSC